MIANMYYISLWNYPEFDIDAAFRLKLVCKLHTSSFKKEFPSLPCLCCYGFESKFVAETLLGKSDRKIRYKEVLEKDFIRADKNREWRIKEDKKENILKWFKTIYSDRECVKVVAKSLKIDSSFIEGELNSHQTIK